MKLATLKVGASSDFDKFIRRGSKGKFPRYFCGTKKILEEIEGVPLMVVKDSKRTCFTVLLPNFEEFGYNRKRFTVTNQKPGKLLVSVIKKIYKLR